MGPYQKKAGVPREGPLLAERSLGDRSTGVVGALRFLASAGDVREREDPGEQALVGRVVEAVGARATRLPARELVAARGSGERRLPVARDAHREVAQRDGDTVRDRIDVEETERRRTFGLDVHVLAEASVLELHDISLQLTCASGPLSHRGTAIRNARRIPPAKRGDPPRGTRGLPSVSGSEGENEVASDLVVREGGRGFPAHRAVSNDGLTIGGDSEARKRALVHGFRGNECGRSSHE